MASMGAFRSPVMVFEDCSSLVARTGGQQVRWERGWLGELVWTTARQARASPSPDGVGEGPQRGGQLVRGKPFVRGDVETAGAKMIGSTLDGT